MRIISWRFSPLPNLFPTVLFLLVSHVAVKIKFVYTLFITLIICVQFLYVQNANSSVTCRKDSLGNEHCYGTDDKGNRVDTTTRKDSLGNTHTYGKIGNQNIDTTTRRDSLGNTTTYGKLGNQNINTTTRKDSLGNTTTYGKLGNDNINIRTRKDSLGNTNSYGKIGNRNINVDARKDSLGNTNYNFRWLFLELFSYNRFIKIMGEDKTYNHFGPNL